MRRKLSRSFVLQRPQANPRSKAQVKVALLQGERSPFARLTHSDWRYYPGKREYKGPGRREAQQSRNRGSRAHAIRQLTTRQTTR